MKLDDKTFKSITFFSKRFTAKHVRMIQHHLEAAGQGLTRTELAKTVARTNEVDDPKWETTVLSLSFRPRTTRAARGHHPA